MELMCNFTFERIGGWQSPIRIERTDTKSKHKSAYHMHDHIQIWYCRQGKYYHRVVDREYECSAGSVMVIPIGTEHQFWYDDSQPELMCLNIRYDFLSESILDRCKQTTLNLFLPEYYEELGLSFEPYRMLCPQSQLVLEKAFSQFVLLNYAPSNAEDWQKAPEALERIFSLPEYAVSAAHWKKGLRIAQTRLCPILRILAYLNENYSEKITDEKLLPVGNISRAVMYRNFKRITKMTYAQYLQYLRCRRTHFLLRETTYSYAHIAGMCGFYNTYHMATTYSKFVGCSMYRQRAKFDKCRDEMNKFTENET